MKNNFIYIAILSMVSVMYPWLRGDNYDDCISNCIDASCKGIGPVQCDNYCIPICKDKHPKTRPVRFVNIGNDRYKSNWNNLR